MVAPNGFPVTEGLESLAASLNNRQGKNRQILARQLPLHEGTNSGGWPIGCTNTRKLSKVLNAGTGGVSLMYTATGHVRIYWVTSQGSSRVSAHIRMWRVHLMTLTLAAALVYLLSQINLGHTFLWL